MRSRRIVIGLAIAAVALVLVGGAWAYDHGRRDTIAGGVRVGGIDVGGMGAGAAAREARARAARAPAPAGRRHLQGQTHRALRRSAPASR